MQPWESWIGKTVGFEGEGGEDGGIVGSGIVTDENETHIYVKGKTSYYDGWHPKEDFASSDE